MQPQRSWIVSPTQVHEVFQSGANAFYFDSRSNAWQPVLIGQSPTPTPTPSGGSSAPWPVLAALAGVVGGIILISFVAESIPGTLIARYGFKLPWGQSILLGVGAAIAFNMVSGLLDNLAGGGASQPAPASSGRLRGPLTPPSVGRIGRPLTPAFAGRIGRPLTPL